MKVRISTDDFMSNIQGRKKNVRKKRVGEIGHLSKGREQLHKTEVDTAPELKANAV